MKLLGAGDLHVGATHMTSLDDQRRALEHVPADRLFPCTDCGLVPRSREASRGKMRALAKGAAIVRSELMSPRPVSLTERL